MPQAALSRANPQIVASLPEIASFVYQATLPASMNGTWLCLSCLLVEELGENLLVKRARAPKSRLPRRARG